MVIVIVIVNFYESNHPPPILHKRQSGLRLRQYFYGRFHQRGNAHGNLQQVPPVLHGYAKADGHYRNGGQVQKARRHRGHLEGLGQAEKSQKSSDKEIATFNF